MKPTRRTALQGLGLGAGLALTGGVGALAQTAQTPVQQHGKLRVQGTKIVGDHGQPVVLRGMSLFWSKWMPQFYNADCIAWLQSDWKCTAIRAAIAAHENGYDNHPERETAKAEAAIDAAIAQGLYVVVDWHAHEPNLDNATRFFRHIVQKYGSHPNLIYETWNEPLPQHDWYGAIKPWHEALIPVIREHAPDNLIVAGTGNWSQDVEQAAADPLDDPNTAYVLHFYAGGHGQDLRDKANAALRQGAALFVTEYGTTMPNGDDGVFPDETRLWWDWMEENHISHLNWSICDKVESSAAVKPGAAPAGGWRDDMITESGHLVRDRIRTMNA